MGSRTYVMGRLEGFERLGGLLKSLSEEMHQAGWTGWMSMMVLVRAISCSGLKALEM